jgi:hypothetical protein
MSFKMTRTIGVLAVAVIAANVASPAAAAPGRSGKFAPASWPEETIYQPECQIVQGDGSRLSCSRSERDW